MLKAEGRDTGGRGNAAAEIVATAESLSPTSTSVTRRHRPADQRQDGPVRAQRDRRRVEEADEPVRRQPQLDARRRGRVRRTPTEPAANGRPTPAAPHRPRLPTPTPRPAFARSTAPTPNRSTSRPRPDRPSSSGSCRCSRCSSSCCSSRVGGTDATDAVATSDRDRVRELLGREPAGAFEIVVRDDVGDPVVIRNAPLLDDGTPMPTRYWLVGPAAGEGGQPPGSRRRRACGRGRRRPRRAGGGPRPIRRRARRHAAGARRAPPDRRRRRHAPGRQVPARPLRLVSRRRRRPGGAVGRRAARRPAAGTTAITVVLERRRDRRSRSTAAAGPSAPTHACWSPS